ncbi:MAG: hypothetical protein JOZ58_21055 [Acetobacteraceae bacterium]|nr:hypothetical protein [Acetobacteraceae bacterium]MBV8577515.1 hypothetical protein [Acetobacteraceae bacterium]
MELPVPGYPISRDAVTEWFRRRHGREPSSIEVGEIMLRMTERDSTPPKAAPIPLPDEGKQ